MPRALKVPKAVKARASKRRSKPSVKVFKNQTEKTSFFLAASTSEDVIYSSLSWAAKDRALSWELIQVLKEHDSIRAGVWAKPVDLVQGKTKIEWCERAAFELLKDNAKFGLYVLDGEERIQAGIRNYGKSTKSQIRTMEENWRKAHDILGEIGQGIIAKDQIQKNSGLYVIWKEKMEKMCSFYYDLKVMIGERMLVIKNVVSNSNNSFSVHNLLESGRGAINFDADVFINTQLDEVMSGGNDDSSNEEEDVEIDEPDEVDGPDEFENRIDSALRFLTQDSASASDPVSASDSASTSVSTATVRETSRPRSTFTSRSISQNAVAISARRRPGVGGVLGDFAEGLRSAQAVSAERKRIRDADLQVTNRQDIQARSDLDKARLEFEREQYRGSQRSELRQQTIAMRLRQDELDLEREKNGLTLIQDKIVLDLTDVDEHVMDI